MTKIKITAFMVSLIILFPSFCRADSDSELKNTFRKSMMEECFNGVTSDTDMPMSLAAKLCRCAIDKTFEKYSVADLIEIDEYGEKFEKFIADMEKSTKECIVQVDK